MVCVVSLLTGNKKLVIKHGRRLLKIMKNHDQAELILFLKKIQGNLFIKNKIKNQYKLSNIL